ncbi:MAG: hypothetical protein ACU4EQ_11995 [Candidatus Nitrosoglobus sp.]
MKFLIPILFISIFLCLFFIVPITALPLETQVFIGVIVVLTIGSHVFYDEKTLAYGPTILTTMGILATFFGIAKGLSNFDTDSAHI